MRARESLWKKTNGKIREQTIKKIICREGEESEEEKKLGAGNSVLSNGFQVFIFSNRNLIDCPLAPLQRRPEHTEIGAERI